MIRGDLLEKFSGEECQMSKGGHSAVHIYGPVETKNLKNIMD